MKRRRRLRELSERTSKILRDFADAAIAWGFHMEDDDDDGRVMDRALARFERHRARMVKLLLSFEQRCVVRP
jgi:hypothetical protein